MRKIALGLIMLSWVFIYNQQIYGNFDTQQDCNTMREYMQKFNFLGFPPSVCVQGSVATIQIKDNK